MDTTIQETGEQIIYNFVPEVYQEQAFWMLGILVAIISIYYLTKPIMDSIKAKRQELAIRESALSIDDVRNLIDESNAVKTKIDVIGKIGEWEYKLMHATSEEAKLKCNTELAYWRGKLEDYA